MERFHLTDTSSVEPSLVVADPDVEVDGYDVDDLSPRCCFSRCRFNPPAP